MPDALREALRAIIERWDSMDVEPIDIWDQRWAEVIDAGRAALASSPVGEERPTYEPCATCGGQPAGWYSFADETVLYCGQSPGESQDYHLYEAGTPPVSPQDDALYSDTSINGVRQTWKEVAEREREDNRALQAFRSILSDLSRCEHGRHLGDVCSECGGPSEGNTIIPPGMVIGHDIGGRAIIVPAKAQFSNAEDWRAARRSTPTEEVGS